MAIHPVVKSLLDEIEAFRARAEMSATAFGTRCLNDPNFLADLRRRGRIPDLVTAERVRAFIRSYKGVQ